MPELPEVETVRLQLLHKIKGKTIVDIVVYNQKIIDNNPHFKKKLIGKSIAHIDRVGKLMIFSFVGEDDLFLLAHLKMTGQFFFIDKQQQITGGGHSQSQSDSQNLPNKHTRVAIKFSDNTHLYFNDMRMFGYLKLANKTAVEATKSKFGQEPIADNFDTKKFYEGLKRRKMAIKAVLLDQSFIAGLGNIYVDETLWQAGVSPTRPANKITEKEATAIADLAGKVMKHSIEVGGTTFQNFLDTDGHIGNYKEHLQVFGKQNTPCPRCGTTIKKTRVAGRGTHHCPNCQK